MTLSSSLAFAGADAGPGAEFAIAHRLVDIGGRKLNLFCSGTGSPTVVFEAPSGTAGWGWWDVQPRVAAKTRACVYDRAGLGFSDPSPNPADATNAVADLHALLRSAGVAPPCVLVGNSFGGGSVQRGVSPYLIPGKPQGDTNKAIEAANLALLAEVAHSSTNGEVRVVAGAGHVIQETHPEAVASAVDDVLAKIKR